MCSVTDKGCALFHESGYNYLAPFAVGNILACLGVDNFKIEIVIPDVHTCVMLAVYADTGTVYLGKTVDIIKLDTQLV